MIIGNNELSMPVTAAQIDDASGIRERLTLLASIVGPLQPHLQQCLRNVEIERASLDHYKRQVEDLRSSLAAVLRSEIRNTVQTELDQRVDSFIHEDNLTERMIDEITNSRRIRSEIEEVATNAIDLDDFKDDIKSDIERELDDKIEDAISNFDFGDVLDDHARTIDAGTTKRLAEEIGDDPNHPLVNALLNALVLRIGNA
jgi:light-regulated signal transduction histidine kinase (bacteriophytochrome)